MNILVAYDGTDGAEAALSAACSIVRETGGRLWLAHAVRPLADAADTFAHSNFEALEVKIREERDRLSARVRDLDVPAEAWIEELAPREDVADGLVRVAQTWSVDIIAIGSRRIGSLRGALLGSVAAAILKHGDRPVLVVRP